MGIKINFKELFEVQRKTHECKKNERCERCGKVGCELCMVHAYVVEEDTFKSYCPECVGQSA